MPVKSPEQMRLMYAAKAGKLRHGAGPSPEVAAEMINKTPRKTRVAFGKKG